MSSLYVKQYGVHRYPKQLGGDANAPSPWVEDGIFNHKNLPHPMGYTPTFSGTALNDWAWIKGRIFTRVKNCPLQRTFGWVRCSLDQNLSVTYFQFQFPLFVCIYTCLNVSYTIFRFRFVNIWASERTSNATESCINIKAVPGSADSEYVSCAVGREGSEFIGSKLTNKHTYIHTYIHTLLLLLFFLFLLLFFLFFFFIYYYYY